MKFNPKLIDFFKKHNLYNPEMFEYFENHSTMLDSAYLDEMMFRACAYQIDTKTGVLKGIHLNMPYVKDEKTMLDSIHELTHAIFAYPQIGRRFKKNKTIEVLPLLYEKLYIMENPSKQLSEYRESLDRLVTEKDVEYQLGIKISNELLKKYNYNPQATLKDLKKISRKYH